MLGLHCCIIMAKCIPELVGSTTPVQIQVHLNHFVPDAKGSCSHDPIIMKNRIVLAPFLQITSKHRTQINTEGEWHVSRSFSAQKHKTVIPCSGGTVKLATF